MIHVTNFKAVFYNKNVINFLLDLLEQQLATFALAAALPSLAAFAALVALVLPLEVDLVGGLGGDWLGLWLFPWIFAALRQHQQQQYTVNIIEKGFGNNVDGHEKAKQNRPLSIYK